MRRILVINLGWEQEPLLEKLQNFDVAIYGVHYDFNYYKQIDYADLLIADLRDLDTIVDYAIKSKVDAVISDECDYSYFAQAIIAEKLDLPGPRIKEAQIATNKYLQRLKAKEHGILIPDFRLVTCVEDIYSFVNDVDFPIIVKPVDNRGSFGVSKINSFEEIKNAYYNALMHSHSRLTLVEKFIEGQHITVDGYVFKQHGIRSLAIANKTLASNGRQVSLDIQYPAKFDIEFENKIRRINELVNTKLGYTFGMTHSEYMVTPEKQIYLIESANRGGGVYTSSIIVPNVSGIDIVDQYICDSLNIDTNHYQSDIQNNKIILKFFNFKPGKIKKIDGIADLLKEEYVLKLRLSVKEGDTVSPITNDADRHGFLIAYNEGADIDTLIKNHIKVTYEN